MKHMFAALALAAVTALSGCAGADFYRGLDASGSVFVSSGMPAVAVHPAEDFKAVISESTMARVGEEDGFFLVHPADVWYTLYAGEGNRQMAVLMAMCNHDWEWDVRALGVEFQRLRVLRSYNGVHSSDATVHVYVRPAALDPWKPFYEKAGLGWEEDILVARYEWTDAGGSNKLLVEYREPAQKSTEDLMAHPAEVDAFIARSQKAFSLAEAAVPLNKGAAIPSGLFVPDRKLAPVLGSLYRGDQLDF